MINYIIQVVTLQLLFLMLYDFFLSKETFFTKNRWYLLITAVLAFLLPLFKVSSVQEVFTAEYMVVLPELVLSPQSVIEESKWYQSIDYFGLVYSVGVGLSLLVFLYKLSKIIRFYFLAEKSEKRGKYRIVELANSTKAFSFFNLIFIGSAVPKSKRREILKHELVHSRQKHSLDLLVFETLKVLMWFNPLLYVYQKRIILVHEYISDAVIAEESSPDRYINQLLSEVFEVEGISFVNQFYKQSQVKKRIVMILKKQSARTKQLRYLLLVPVMVFAIMYTSCSEAIAQNTQPGAQKDLIEIILASKNKSKRITTKKTGYFNLMMGTEHPDLREVPLMELTKEELAEYERLEKARVKHDDGTFLHKPLKVLEDKGGRKILFIYLDMEAKASDDNSVAFGNVEFSPTFPGCEDGNSKCLSTSISKFVVENLDMKSWTKLGLKKERHRAYAIFMISDKGTIEHIGVRAPHEKVKKDIVEVLKKLPKLKPGKVDGKEVSVKYTLPITFTIY